MGKAIAAHKVCAKRFGKPMVLIGHYTDAKEAQRVADLYLSGQSEPTEMEITPVSIDSDVIGCISPKKVEV